MELFGIKFPKVFHAMFLKCCKEIVVWSMGEKKRHISTNLRQISLVCASTFHLRRKHETSEVNRILSAAAVHSVRSYVTHKIRVPMRC